MESISVKMVSFTQFFACSWFWKVLNLQNQKHRCRWPMSLLQNQEHSIWTEGTVRSLHIFGMSFGCLLDVFWVSFGLLDGHIKYQELGFPTGCGEKRWKCHHNTSKIKEWKIVKKIFGFQCNIMKIYQIREYACKKMHSFDMSNHCNTFDYELLSLSFFRLPFEWGGVRLITFASLFFPVVASYCVTLPLCHLSARDLPLPKPEFLDAPEAAYSSRALREGATLKTQR